MSPDRIRPGSARRQGEPEHPEPAPDTTLETEEASAQAPTVDPSEEAAVVGVPRSASDDGLAAPPEVQGAGERTSDTVDEAEEDLGPGGVDEALYIAASRPPVQHGRFRRLYYGETSFDFVRRKHFWFTISSVIILAGVISLGVRGLNLSIDFVGGTSWTINSTTLQVPATETAVANAGLSGATVVVLGTGSSQSIEVQAKLPKNESSATQNTQANDIAGIIAKLAHQPVGNVSIESVGPSWGGQVTHKAIIALIVFFILIALYISIFFEWRMAFAAIVAVVHDVLVTVGVYSLSGFLVTPDTIVAFLTILGYSLYDTIVVFDRIRDNVKNLSVRDRLTFSDMVNLSMNQTLARSVNTSLVAIMPILAVLVLGAQILGATTLQYFGLALLVGLTTGAYSSIFIASPLVAVMKEREPRYRQLRERLELRGGSRWLLSAADVARGIGSDDRELMSRGAQRRAEARLRASGEPSADGASNGAATSVAPSRSAAATRAAQRRPAQRSRRKGGRR